MNTYLKIPTGCLFLAIVLAHSNWQSTASEHSDWSDITSSSRSWAKYLGWAIRGENPSFHQEHGTNRLVGWNECLLVSIHELFRQSSSLMSRIVQSHHVRYVIVWTNIYGDTTDIWQGITPFASKWLPCIFGNLNTFESQSRDGHLLNWQSHEGTNRSARTQTDN